MSHRSEQLPLSHYDWGAPNPFTVSLGKGKYSAFHCHDRKESAVGPRGECILKVKCDYPYVRVVKFTGSGYKCSLSATDIDRLQPVP